MIPTKADVAMHDMYTATLSESRDSRIVEEFRTKYPGLYLVASRIDDPLFQPGRARLIWRANTANAVEKLGIPPAILFQGDVSLGSPDVNQELCRIELNQFYGTEFKSLVTTVFSPEKGDRRAIRKQAEKVVFGALQPFVGFVHNRDPHILEMLCRCGMPFVYEDHNEDFHVEARPSIVEKLNHSSCKGVIAITNRVKAQLLALGVNPNKVMVCESGVSEGALVRRTEEAKKCRKFLLGNFFTSLAVYSGGLQAERGIAHILRAAHQHPSTLFLLAGGNEVDENFWKNEVASSRLPNVRISGYMSVQDIWIMQQAADVLLLTREHGPRSQITSPLKLFEYLASGRPIIHYHSVELEDYAKGSVHFSYDNENPASLGAAIGRVLKSNSWDPDPIKQNKNQVNEYTWTARARRILSMALEHEDGGRES